MTSTEDRPKPYKPTEIGWDTWTIMCPINDYYFERKICVNDSGNIEHLSALRLQCTIRYPEELTGSFVEIKLREASNPVVVDTIDADYAGVGVFRSIKNDESEKPALEEFQPAHVGAYAINVFVEENILKDFADILLHTEENKQINREVHAEIAGLLNEWTGKGGLCVTTITLVASGHKPYTTPDEAET